MARPRIGTVDHISGFVSGDGQQLISIDGKQYAASINFRRYPVSVGSQVEYRTAGNRAEILAVQAELLPVPQAQNLFSNASAEPINNCSDCIGTAGDCECLKLQSAPAPTKRTDPYAGPFPRKRHSHRCMGCVERGQTRSVGCYKAHCTKPQTTEQCAWCAPSKVTK